MNVFTELFDRLMAHEGGYVNHPNDPGGETMWGVTKRVARAHGYNGPMRSLPKSLAQEIADKSYWQAIQGDKLDRAIAWQLVDAAYNHGNRNAVKFLQRAVGVSDDGIIGPRTLAAVNAKDKNDVLIVNASGNEGADLDTKNVYPNDAIGTGAEVADNFISVGSLDPKYGSAMVSGFSNYGKINVELSALQ